MIHPLPPVQRKEVRELERCAQKLAKSGCSLLFNGTCLNENVLPNYSKIILFLILTHLLLHTLLIRTYFYKKKCQPIFASKQFFKRKNGLGKAKTNACLPIPLSKAWLYLTDTVKIFQFWTWVQIFTHIPRILPSQNIWFLEKFDI